MSFNLRGLAALAALLAGLSAGCASSTAQPLGAPSQQGSGSSSGASVGTGNAMMMRPGGSCPSTSTDPAIVKLRAGFKQQALPRDFHPIAAVRCQTSIRIVPGDGEWQFADAQRADSGLAGLVAALQQPSQATPTDAICPAMALALPPFALVDASGKLVSPLLPHTMCGFPLKQVTDAIEALPWRTETEQRLNQTRTQAEIDTGCPSAYKNEFEIGVLGTPQPWSQARQLTDPRPTAVCIYAAQPPVRTDISAGSFTHGAKLTSAQQADVVTGLANASQTAAPSCTARASRLALVDGPGAGILAELDGCKRIRWPNGFMTTAPEAFLQFLTMIGNG
jgi:hypothetical protein